MPEPAQPIQVDIVSDVVCPWCIVGYRQLLQASDSTGIEIRTAWHPFELNPDMPPEGQDLREHIMEKYGSTAEDSARARARLTDLGRELGFTFAFSDGSRMVNTFRAHQLIHWAEQSEQGQSLKMALFRAYFTEGRDVSDIDTLARIAGETGLDPEEARRVLDEGLHAEVVRAREQFWQQQGIRGVPAMVFERQHLVTGAQGADNYEAILRHLVELRAA